MSSDSPVPEAGPPALPKPPVLPYGPRPGAIQFERTGYGAVVTIPPPPVWPVIVSCVAGIVVLLPMILFGSYYIIVMVAPRAGGGFDTDSP